MPSEQSIQKFRQIYQKEFGIEISVEEAAKQAQRLVNFARVVCRPMPKRFEARYKEIKSHTIDKEEVSASPLKK